MFLGYILKTLWRHRTRTFLTVSGSAVAMFVYCFVGSVQQGLNQLTESDDANRTLVVFQENRFCPTSSQLPEDYARQIMKVSGVQEVMPVQVWTNNCRASLNIVVFNGARPSQLQKRRPLELLQGDWGTFESKHDGALVGQNVAKRQGLRLGDQFTIGDISVNVAGIFRSENPSEDSLIFCHLEFLQRAMGRDSTGIVTQHEVFLDPKADPDRLSAQIDAKLKSGVVATKTRRKGAFQAGTLSDLLDLIGFAHWLGYACVGLVLSLVATTTVMSVQDRMKEYAVLQTIGVRPWATFRMVLTESTLLCLGGGLIGILAANLGLAWGGFAIGAEGVAIAFQPSIWLAITGVLVSVGVGILAGLAPAFTAATVPIIKALQE